MKANTGRKYGEWIRQESSAQLHSLFPGNATGSTNAGSAGQSKWNAKGKYILESVLHQKISIAVGKYQSDRMSLELQKLRMALESTDGAEQQEVLTECKSLLEQLIEISRKPADTELEMER